MLRAMLRDLRAHQGRIGLTLVAIVLGVAFVVATWVVSDSTAKTVTGAGTRSNVDVAVRAQDGGPPLAAADLDRLAGLSEVDQAIGVLAGKAALVGRDGKIIVGRHDRAGTGWDGTGRFELVDGHAPRHRGEVALGQPDARRAGLGVGDTARTVLADGASDRSRVVGIYTYRTLGVETAPAVAFAGSSAPDLLEGRYTRIELTAAPGTTANALAATVTRTLDRADLRVDTGTRLAMQARDDALDAAQSTRESLLVFAAVALLVGMFVIANTFTILVTQRIRQFALLRAVGASRRQVRRAVLVEAAALGLAGATIGSVLGVGLGLLAMWGFQPDGETVAYAVSPLAILVGYAVGVGVTVVAAYGSARRAAAVAPVTALRTDATPPRRAAVVRSVAGVLLIAAGVAMIAGTAGGGLATTQRIVGLAGGVVGWLGVLLLAPMIAGALLAPVARLFGQRGGPAARLATRNAVRDPRRTAATSSALLVGLALVCSFATLGESMVSLFGSSMRATVPSSTTIVRSAAGGEALGTDVLDKVRATPGVRGVAADRYGFIGVSHAGGSSRTTVSAIEPEAFPSVLTPSITSGSADLRRGVVVGSNEAAMLGVGVGDEVTLRFPDASVRQRIVGLYETTEAQPLFYLDVARAPAWFRSRVTSVYATGADPAAVRTSLDTAFRDRADVLVTDREGVIESQMGEFALLLSVMYAMFGAAIVIAIFGVINTLALSVTERTREIGVLRAVGAPRRLIRRTVRLESVVICGYGGLLGIAVGLAFGAVMQHVMLGSALFEITVPYGVIAVSLAGMVLVGVLAALWPARRAARSDMLRAIATE